MTETAVALRDVFCVHRTSEGDAAALQGLTLELADGEHLCILGPSGSGKSTLLRVIAGLQEPSAGSVIVFGRDPGRISRRERARLRHRWVGFLYQHAEATLAPDLSLEQAVTLPLALRGVPRPERRSRVVELLRAAGLEDRADALPGQLSGGERQCAALCAALAHRPLLLLADEPTAELDERSAARVADLIAELGRSNGTTVIVVSHDAAMADHAQRAIRIRDGRVVEDLDGARRSLVVGRGGWIRLPHGLLGQAGIDASAEAQAVDGGLLLTPTAERERRQPDRPQPKPTPGQVIQRARAARVQLRSVTRSRGRGAGRAAVLQDLTATFEPGVLTAITGRSGAGKTTLLELLACMRRPESGELVLDGRSLHALHREQLADLRRERIGYLPQEPAPIAFLSALENITLALRLRRIASGEASERADAALRLVGMAERSRQRVQRLSAGEAQRVALARALACARGLLIVDEPTSRLDEDNATTVAVALCEAAAEGQTVICATHDPDLIRYADRVLELAS